jgi:hypothetical protein
MDKRKEEAFKFIIKKDTDMKDSGKLTFKMAKVK